MKLFVWLFFAGAVAISFAQEKDFSYLFASADDPSEAVTERQYPIGDLAFQKDLGETSVLCLSDIMMHINISPERLIKQFGQFRDLAELIVGSICFSGVQQQTVEDALVLQPIVTNEKFKSAVRLFVHDGKRSFSAGIRYLSLDPIKVHLVKIPLVEKVLSLATLSNVVIIFAESPDRGPLLGVENIRSGITVVADINFNKGTFLADTLGEINLDQLQMRCTIPPGVTNVQQVKVELLPLKKSLSGICLIKLFEPIMAKMGIKDIAKPVFDMLKLLCFGTDLGIMFDEYERLIFYIQGQLKNLPAYGAVKIRARSADDESDSNYIFSAGLRLRSDKDMRGGDKKLGELIPVLSYLDKVISVRDIVLSVSNDHGPKNVSAVDGVRLFDVDQNTKQINPAAPEAVTIGYGVGLSAIASSGKLFDDIKGINILSKMLKSVRVQVALASKNDIKTKIVRVDGKPFEIKVSEIPGFTELSGVSLLKDMANITVSAGAIDVVESSDGIEFSLKGRAKGAHIQAGIDVLFYVQGNKARYSIVLEPQMLSIDSSLEKFFEILGLNKARIVINFDSIDGSSARPTILLQMPESKKPLCMSAIKDVVPTVFKPLFDVPAKIASLPDFCIERKDVRVVAHDGGVTIAYDGTVGEFDVSLYSSLKKNGAPQGIALKLQVKGLVDLGVLNNKLKGVLTLQDPLLIIATQPMGEGEWGPMALAAGLSMYAKVFLGGALGDVLEKLKISSEVVDIFAKVTVPFNTSAVDGYVIELQKDLGAPIKLAGDLIKIHGFSGLLRGGVPPSLDLNLDAILQLPGGKPISLVLGGSVSGPSFELRGVSKCIAESCPMLDFGKILPIKIRAVQDVPLSISMHVAGGLISGFSGSGVIDLLGKTSEATFDVDAANVLRSGMKCKIEQLCVEDFPKLYLAFFGNATGFDTALLEKIPHVFCMQDVDLSFAQSNVDIEGVSIEPGIRLSGKFVSRVVPVAGAVSLAIIPPTLAKLVSQTMDIGLQGDIHIEKVNLLGGLIKIASVDEKSGPLLHVRATAKEQSIIGSADVVLVNDNIFHEKALLSLDTNGLVVSMYKKIMGFGAEFAAHIPMANPSDTSILYTFTDDISEKIQGKLGDVIRTAKNKANEEFHKGVAKIQKIIKLIPEGLRKGGILQGILDQIDKFADTINGAFDKALDFGKISIQKVQLGARLGDFGKGLLSGTVDGIIFGKPYSFALNPFVANDSGSFITSLVRTITDTMNLPGVNIVDQQLKIFKDKVKQAFGIGKKVATNG